MYIIDQTGCFRFQINILGKEEFGVTNAGLGVKGYVLADSATDIIVEVGAFHIAQESQPKELPVLFLELHVDGILRNIVRPRTGRGLADGQFAEAKIDRGVVLARNGKQIMKRFRFIDLDLDDAILNSRLVEEAGTIELKVLNTSVQPSIEDEDKCLLPSRDNDRGAVSLLNGELNNTVGVRFDDGEAGIADNKYASLQQTADCMQARRTWPLGKLIAHATFVYGSVDLMNSLRVIPQNHKYFQGPIAIAQRQTRHRCYVVTDSKLIQKALFESDYSLGARIREQIQTENPPPPSNPSPETALSTDNRIEPRTGSAESHVSIQKPNEITIPSACTLRTETTPITPQKTPAQITRHRPSSLTTPIEKSNIEKTSGMGPLTPEATPIPTSVIYISSDDEEDINFLQQRKAMKLQDSPLRFRRGRK